MALPWSNFLQKLLPISAFLSDFEKDLNLSTTLVNKLKIPDDTKQFVFAIQDPQTYSLIYILYVHGLSERSALDTEILIRAVQPNAVISDWSWAFTIDHDFGDSPDKPIPTSAFAVMKQCLLYNTNKYRYQNVARNCLAKEIFGVGYEGHHVVAKKIANEIGSCFLMGSPRYFKIKPVEAKTEVSSYKVPLFAKNLYPVLELCSLNRPLDSVHKLLVDVENGANIGSQDLPQVYSFRSAIESLRMRNYREGRRCYANINTAGGSNVGKFSEFTREERSQYLAAQGIREQAKTFKKIVVITGQDELIGIRKFWNYQHFPETKGMTGNLYVRKEDSGVDFSSFVRNDGIERRSVSFAAGVVTTSLAISVLCGEKMSSVYNFVRREKRGFMPWFGLAGFGTWLEYADVFASVPNAHNIARLGRGIQSLKEVSRTIRRLGETPVTDHQE